MDIVEQVCPCKGWRQRDQS